jgi:DNA repair protein RecO (recombination protein O)
MEENHYTQALILNRSDWREVDSRVLVYTEKFGKLSLIARGTKKPASKLAGHIEPSSLADILILNGKNREYLASSLITQAYFNIKNDLNALYYAGQALAWLDKLTKEGEADPVLFLSIKVFFDRLNDLSQQPLDKNSGIFWFLAFRIKILANLGYQPELYHCLECHRTIVPGHNHFQARLGGLLCENCFILHKNKFLPAEILTITDNCIKILRFLSEQQDSKIKFSPSLQAETEQIVNSFLTFI